MTRIKKIDGYQAMAILAGIQLGKADLDSMDICLKLSTDMWAGYIDGRLATIWGVIPPTLLSLQAYLWMWTTDALTDHPFLLIRHSQLAIEELLRNYETIVGHVVVGNHKAVRWLKWLGAKFGDPSNGGIPFRITRQSFEVRKYG